MSSNTEKEFDIVIFGASGFAGKYVVEYVTKISNNSGLKWAIAGRDSSKLAEVLAEVSAFTGKCFGYIHLFCTLNYSSDVQPTSLQILGFSLRVSPQLLRRYTRLGLSLCIIVFFEASIGFEFIFKVSSQYEICSSKLQSSTF